MDDNPKYISEEQQELFERFLMREMPVAEQLSFKARLADNENLQKSFEEFKALFETVEEAGLREKMNAFHRTIEQKEKAGVRKLNTSRFPFSYRIAASIAILMTIGGLWFFNRQNFNNKLFNDYYSPDPGLPTVMGANDDYEFYEAMVNYKHGDYDLAIEKWEKQLAAKPTNDTLNYFLGAAYLANKKEKESIPLLQKTAGTEESVFLKDANFYLGMAYLKMGKLTEAKKYLKTSEVEAAGEIIAQLPE